MHKTVWKLRPQDYWRIGEHESWFADMAAQGLHLKKVGLQFVKFEQGEPQAVRYRIDVSQHRITDEQKSLYREYGWEFVTAYGRFNVFSSPEALGAPELHTEAAEQGYTLQALDKSHHKLMVITSLAMVLFFGIMFGVFFLNPTPFLSMAEDQFLQQCILVVVMLYVFYTSIQASLSIGALKKSMLEGQPIDHHADWRKSRRIGGVVAGFFLVAAVISIVLPVMSIVKSENYSLPEGDVGLPIVRLAEIENNPDLKREPGYVQGDIDWSNRLSYDWSPLAPIRYETDEHGTVPGAMWKDGSGEYSPSISTWFYRLTWAAMADGLIGDLVERYVDRYDDGKLQAVSPTTLDNLYIADSGEKKQIFASLGRNVIYIRYYGYADMDDIIPLVSEKLTEQIK